MKTTRESARFLSTKELSELLGIPEGTLRQWRCSEVGPKWHKLRGSVRYDKSDVENFLRESERIPSLRAHMEEHLVSVFVPKIVVTVVLVLLRWRTVPQEHEENQEDRCGGC